MTEISHSNMCSDQDAGEKHAWVRRLVHEHQSPLIRYARSIVQDEHIASDLVQETYLRLCQQSPDDLEGREAAWLFRVCHNLAVNRHRKERRMTIGTPVTESNCTPIQSDPAGDLATAEDNDHVTRLINDLPENQQKVIRLKFYGGLKYKEISQSTGLTEGNVGFLLHTALGTLRERMRLLGTT